MTADTLSSFAPSPQDEARRRHKLFAIQGCLLLGEVLTFIWLIARLTSSEWVQAALAGQFFLAMAAASISIYCAAIRRRKLYLPLQQLELLVPQIRAGRLPMEELSKIGGNLTTLARLIHEIMRDNRTSKMSLAEMEREVRQRIANRTEALERKIGSLHNQATRDPLTGLLNRRALDEHLAQAMERCTNKGVPLSVMMIDVDHFKLLNDTLGHAAGDELLRSIGQLLRSTLRETDSAFRCGGDEFIVVLEGMDTKQARSLSDRLVALVDGLTKTLKVPITPRFSIGAACLAEVVPQTAEALLDAADKRLYAVKGDRRRTVGIPHAATAPVRKSA